MIVTESVYQLVSDLCGSFQKQHLVQFQPQTSQQTKCFKRRVHEILLKSLNAKSELPDMQELYLHSFEFKMKGEGAKHTAMQECCQLVEQSEYFQTEGGKSVLQFLLILRNTGDSSYKVEHSFPNYFFNSYLIQQRSYFSPPLEMLRFNGAMLEFRKGTSGCGKSYFGISVESQSNQFISSLLSPYVKQLKSDRVKSPLCKPFDFHNLPSNAPIDSTLIRCVRWDNLGQTMDFFDKRFSTEVDCTNEILAMATPETFEVKLTKLPQFIADVKLLVTGIRSDSFHLDDKKLIFYVETNLTIENVSPETIAHSINQFLVCGSCYRRLQILMSRNPIDYKHKFDGFVFKTLCNTVSSFLVSFNQFVFLFDDTFIAQMLLRMSSMMQQIEMLSQILQVHPKSTIPMEKALAVLPRGSKFLNYLHNKFFAESQTDLAMLMFSILKDCCAVYFKKFESWIFHGFIEDTYKELFIEFVDFYQPNTKHFWDKAYTIKRHSVPSFLIGCEESALLCGKYTMLLRMCKPAHPLFNIAAPSIGVCISNQQIAELQINCRKYIEDAHNLCGPFITVRHVYQQKSIKRKKFRERCAMRFQEILRQWHEEQVAKKMKDNAIKEKHRKMLEEQIEENRDRKIRKRIENLAKDQEYLRKQEDLENDRLALENLQRQKTLEYYEELGRIVSEQQQRVTDKIQMFSRELNEKSVQNDESTPLQNAVMISGASVTEVSEPLDDPNTLTESNFEVNLKKSASDYFNSNVISSEFTSNKNKVLGSTIEFNDMESIPPAGRAKILVEVENNENISVKDANSNELHTTLTERQKNKAKVLQSKFNICPIVVKIASTTEQVLNTEFQNNQQKSAAHTDIFGNEIVNKFQTNRSRVLAEEYGRDDRSFVAHHGNKNEIALVDWKPIRTSMSLEFSKENRSNFDAPTPMSIDTPTIQEDIEEVIESQLKIQLTSKHIQQSMETLDENDALNPTPDSALNTCGILNKHGFSFETGSKTYDCYQLIAPSNIKSESFFAWPTFDEAEVNNYDLNDVKNASTTTLGNFLKMSFAIPINARLSILNNEILKIFLEDLDTLSHLKSLRNYYFMMDGEFSSYISDGLITRLESTKNPAELFNFQFLHNILHNALNSSVYGNDQNADRLSFLIADVPEHFDLASPNVLRALNLSYRIDWPLNLVLTPEAMSHYATIFQHLLKLRRISWVLEQCYQILKEVSKTSTQNICSSPQYRHVQQIRSKLLTFVNALQNHITSTALQGSWRAFKLDVESTKSIDDLYHKHAKYLKRVKFLCMLNRGSNEFFIKLEDVLIVILRFFYQLKQRPWRANNTHPNFEKFLIIEKDFEKLVKFIIRIGSKISRCGYQTEIGDLINVIDFNGFYQSKAMKS
ncbi:Gamma-tubulin complex component 6 [Pseudolycoriella hygida]|uniref:Gamma-tubulin complex component 6 n=1 Tax=Pseudolycoriella hygida TaxID=35572 RepID=A0A9Q0RW61_9DIPT|nr:Gamma-tubulin complex component 6 [Pseudolycoriella hygida]